MQPFLFFLANAYQVKLPAGLVPLAPTATESGCSKTSASQGPRAVDLVDCIVGVNRQLSRMTDTRVGTVDFTSMWIESAVPTALASLHTRTCIDTPDAVDVMLTAPVLKSSSWINAEPSCSSTGGVQPATLVHSVHAGLAPALSNPSE